jgi:tRNA-intron endonuclease, archaea type
LLREAAEQKLESQEKAPEIVQATLRGERVTVEDSARFGELEEAGYGERDGRRLTLKDYEALYLVFSGRLRVTDADGKTVTFDHLAEMCQGHSRDAWTKFIIFRDLRARGYVVKDGFGFGTDLRVYERGDFPEKAAKFVVFAMDEGTETKVEDLSESVRQIVKMGKEVIVAVIERRGEVIYYKVSRANFRR